MMYGMENSMSHINGRAAMPRLVKLALAATACAGALALFGANADAQAVNANQATRIYNRIAGIPPTAAELQQMQAASSPTAAALIATNDPKFYNDTIRNMAAPWTNRDQSVFVPLNDYTATVIGMVRDDIPFNTVLSANILYTVNSPGLPPPSASNNNHYATAEADGVDFSTALTQTTQTAVYGTPAQGVSGIWTTYTGAAAYFVLGTNRAQFRFTMLNYLCHDMQLVMDNTRPTDRIRQDV